MQHGLNNIGNFAELNDEFKAVLDHHAPIKQSKQSKLSQNHILIKLLEKIMNRSRLKIKLINQVKKKIKDSITFNEIKSVNYIINFRKHILKKNVRKETT